MADANRCPNCGSELPPSAPRGICPRCLPQQGLDSDAFSLAGGGTPAATMSLTAGPDDSSALARLAGSLGPLIRVLLRDPEPAADPGRVVEPGSPEMPPTADPAARLQLLGEIARGGMGAILKGRDSDIGRDLAVKVLLEQHRDRPDLIRRFIEEAQIAGQLQHPGVVPVYELGAFADRRPYFTMKLVKGRTLADVLDTRPDPAADQPRVLGIFLQVCQTVAYAHARGVIHRDLKPSNVMVGSFGEVQVMDWGLAKILPRGGASDDAEAGRVDVQGTIIATARSRSDAERSQAGSVMGTPAYMAPEQARGEIDRVDERADVFALGSILCEVLTGEAAFTGRSAGEIQRKAARGELADAFARLEACGADAELFALARACLAAEREDRPRDAGGAVSWLSSYLAGVQERLRAAELARAAESARAEEAQRTAAAAELARAAESARAEEAQARVVVERSRRRRTMALAASLLVMTTLGGLTFSYITQERQARAAALERRLGRAATLLDQARDRPDDPALWRTAQAAVQQVEDDPAGIAPEARDRFARLKADAASGLRDAEGDATLRLALVGARANQQEAGREATDGAYTQAFRAARLDIDALSVTEAADRLKRRPAAVVVELAAYLDHWSDVRLQARQPAASWRRPLDLARAADADDYRNRLRALLTGDDRKAVAAKMRALADEPQAAELPAPTAVLLAAALEGAGDREAAVGLLRRGVARHPDDVWVNFSLAETVGRLRPAPREEAARYYTVARALRPETAHDLAHLLEEMGRGAEAEATFRDLVSRPSDTARNLACFGRCLKDHGRADEASQVLDSAVTAARAALKNKPDDAPTHVTLGIALLAQGKPADAEAQYRAALKLKPDDALIHINLGNALMDQGKPADAEAECRAALKLKPDYAVARSNLGLALLAQGKPADAAAAFRAALKLQPDLSLAHNGLGSALMAQGKPADAAAEFRAALKLKPDLAQAHYNLGLALLDQGKPADAAAAFRAALKLQPDYAVAHSNLGNALTAQGKPADAEAQYRAALKLQPDYAEAHSNLGGALMAQGKPADAAAECRAALKLQPDYAMAHCNLGLALLDQGKPADAAAECRAALKLKPDYAEAHSNLGSALWAQGKPADAAAEFRAALKLKPDYAEAHSNLGGALMAQGKPADAAAEFRAALKLKPDLAQAHYNLGNALMAQGKPADAAAECRAALKLQPDLAQAHCNLGLALLAQGKPADAAAEFRAALKLQPDLAQAHYNLGNALAAQGKPADAVAEYRAALKLKPDYAEAHCNLGHLLRQAGRYAEALEELRRGHELGSRRPDWRYPSAHWVREAERLAALDARLPAVLKGDARPADAAEGLAFAQFCYDRKLHAAAARLYAEALRTDRKLADDRQAQHPYNAACAAALAGCGRGKDEPPPDEAARAKLRGQSLGWLKDELATWSKIIASGKPEARTAIRQELEHWKTDPDLDGLRDEAGLAKLPEEERRAWHALWADVERLLKKAKGDRP